MIRQDMSVNGLSGADIATERDGSHIGYVQALRTWTDGKISIMFPSDKDKDNLLQPFDVSITWKSEGRTATQKIKGVTIEGVDNVYNEIYHGTYETFTELKI